MTATVYANGRVLTMEPGEPVHDALGVRDGRVVARGDVADVRRAVGAGAADVDLRGATVMPGIVDTHPHVMHFGLIEGPCVDLKDATLARRHRRAHRRARADDAEGRVDHDDAGRRAALLPAPLVPRPRRGPAARPPRARPRRRPTIRCGSRPGRPSSRTSARSTRPGLARLGHRPRHAGPGRARVDREGRARRADRHPARLGDQLLHRRRLHEPAALPAADAAAGSARAGHGSARRRCTPRSA